MYKQEFRDKVAQNRSVGLAEPALRQYTFANDKGYNSEIDKAKKYPSLAEALAVAGCKVPKQMCGCIWRRMNPG